MTEQERQLLLKVLCEILPYGLIVEVCAKDKDIKSIDCIKYDTIGTYIRLIDDEKFSVKPYLRPMSSMTDKEFKELTSITELQYDQLELVDWGNCHKTLEFYLEEVPQYCVVKVFDCLNACHLDHRGLIPIGLALPAPEGMYK